MFICLTADRSSPFGFWVLLWGFVLWVLCFCFWVVCFCVCIYKKMKIRTELILGFQNLFFWNLKQKWKVGNSVDSVFFIVSLKAPSFMNQSSFCLFFSPFLARFANNLCWNFSFYCQDVCLELRIRFWISPNGKMWPIWLKLLGFDALCNLVKLNGFSCYWLWYNLVDYCLVWLID